MKKLLYLLAACTGFIFPGCTYAPNGAHFEEVDPRPKTDGASITLGNGEDTLGVRGSMEVQYSLNLPHLELYQAQFRLNGVLIHTTEEKDGSFYLESTKLADGVHEIKAVLRTTSGTNSLADKVGTEQLQMSQSWKILVDNARPSPVKGTMARIVDGRLQVSWAKYKRLGFRSYTVYKHNLETREVRTFATLPHPDSTSWTDHSYLGGKVGYSITVSDDKGLSANGEIVPFEVPIPKIKSFKLQNDEDLLVEFSPSRLYRNFVSYILTAYTSPPDATGKQLFASGQVHDTLVTVRDLPFGDVFSLNLATNPRENRHQIGIISHEVPLRTGTRFYSANPGSGIRIEYYTPETQMFYGFAPGDTLVALQGADLRVVSKAKLRGNPSSYPYHAATSRTVSPNGKYVYVAEGDRLLRLDPLRLTVMQSFPVSALVRNPGFVANGVSVSNNNRLAIGGVNNLIKDSVYVVDMDQQKVLFKLRSHLPPQLSRDGKMLQVEQSFYPEATPGTFTPFLPGQGTPTEAAFHPSADQVVILFPQTMAVYHTATGALLKSFPRTTYLNTVNIDAATGHLGGRFSPKQYGVCDLNTGQVIKTIPLATTGYQYRLLQHKLFANDHFLRLGL